MTHPDEHVQADTAAERLLADLGRAHAAAAAAAGREPLGVRAVELAPGTRGYLCAFDGPAFLCLDADLRPETRAHRVREIAGAGLMWEHLEDLLDAEALVELARVIGQALARGGEPREVGDALQLVAARAIEVARWRDQPQRALASLVEVDAVTALQERLHAAYALFVRASDPLVEMQDRLDPELVATLRRVEQAAGAARAVERLTDMLARALPECAEGGDRVVQSHVTPLT